MKTLSVFFLISIITCFHQQSSKNELSNKVFPSIKEKINTEKGIIYLSNNNGASWNNISNGFPENVMLSDIDINGNIIGVATKKHSIFFYNFITEKWQTVFNKPTLVDIDAILFSEDKIFVGSRGEGIFLSKNSGESWVPFNYGLENLTIRRLVKHDNTIYACTNGGLFTLEENSEQWYKEFGDKFLQVNGITFLDNEVFIATNQGGYKTNINQKNWQKMPLDYSFHNISVSGETLYALAYNELFASNDKGNNWQNDQAGIPKGMYTFQLLQTNNYTLAGQWDGIYKKDYTTNWIKWNKGLPTKIPITELKGNENFLVAASSGWYKGD